MERQNFHQRTPNVIFTEIARLRFAGFEITGEGKIALVLNCCRKVVLCSWPLEAQSLRAESCGPNCSHASAPEGRWHTIQVLDVPVPEPRLNIRNRALLERD